MSDEATRDAVHGNRLHDLKLLLDDEEWVIDVNRPDEHGWTYLMYAVRFNLVDIFNYLLSKGAVVNATKPGDGNACIHMAAYEGHLELCRLLLQHGASAATRNRSGVQPHSIAQAQGHEAVRLLLLEALK